MHEYDLTITTFLERATELYGHKEIVTKLPDGGLHRYTYADAADRIAQLAHALDEFGLDRGDRVAAMAANHFRHYELYFGPACSGRSVHTVNHRLPDEHLVHIINEAEDRLAFVDPEFLETVEGVADDLETVERYVVLADEVPDTSLGPVVDYESFIDGYATEYDWPDLDEDTECGLCYTSGTTGLPKGVQYYHRKVYLHTMAHGHVDVFGVGERDTVMPVVPMFHVNGWGFPYTATFFGSGLVLPGGHTDVESVAGLIDDEDVTVAAAVPTVWIDMESHLGDDEAGVLDSLDRVLTGGSSPPESLMRHYDEVYEAPIHQGYGMTEASPHLVNTFVTTEAETLPEETRYRLRMKAGIPAPGVQIRLRDSEGEPVPHDGETRGEIHARAPWLIDEYYERPEANEESFSEDGWFETGDIGTIDEHGYLDVVDRLDDVIKSGGEWIPSIQLENELMGHDGVEEAVVIGADHEKWQERPVAYVVRADGSADEAALREHLLDRYPKWWLPDLFVFVEDVPRTTTGKFDKKLLRDSFDEEFGTLPTEE
ncbi:long-chain fatty acid--CoA ligase [Halorarum halobium]|uniref:long-chain fatty acid--CoA ligase n=1 Tax=Halorarum halobium TaxID=3075121 RepID=UPI0028ADC3EA|nr:long-chain fatty acid--CoA ligase [Halobaculum sp. XH14]